MSDRTGGVPGERCLDLPGDPDIQRILVMKWSAMGDVALAGAVFEDIHRAFPGRQLDLDTLPPWDALYRDDPRFTRVHAFALRGRGAGLRQRGARLRQSWTRLGQSWKWLQAMRQARYDLVIDLQTSDRSRLMLGALLLSGAGPRYRLGNKRAWPYNLAPAASTGTRHALEISATTLGVAGIPTRTEHPVLHPGARHREQACAKLTAAGLTTGRFAVFLPGCQAAGYLKRWGDAHYAELARRVLAAGIERVVLLGGADETQACAAIAAAVGPRVLNWCGRTELLELAVICEAAAFTVGNDTGTGHIAASANLPLVCICGPTDPRRVRPAGRQVRTVQLELPCSNCYRKHCAHHSCMRLLSPARVMTELADCLPRR